ncbi:hypothetical protein D1BOALGB6SA_9933 [Olavius sp. associated proteobacterium Delta 1]|nr:hypothetical protein D1BOALGB6SA_9933 [Olavius sp. associated proteobacterium Delta 1]
MKQLNLAIFLILSLLIFDVEAGSRELARKLADTQLLYKVFENHLTTCAESMKMSPEELYEANPRQFGGITPDSLYWKDVKKLTSEYYESACNYMTIKEFTEFYVDAYASRFSDAELVELIDFYSSKLGQKAVAAQHDGNAKFQTKAYELMTQKMIEANKKYTAQILKLIDQNNKKK